jgi:hypothetical protein
METFQYTIDTPAFTLDGLYFPANNLTVTLDSPYAHNVSIAGLTFDGWPLSTANTFAGEYLSVTAAPPPPQPPYGWPPLGVPLFDGLTSGLILHFPTVSGVPIVNSGPNFISSAGVIEYAADNGHYDYTTYSKILYGSSVTITGFNLPEPGTWLLLITALAMLATCTRRSPVRGR